MTTGKTEISLAPDERQLDQIAQWLDEENSTTGEGLYPSLHIIKAGFAEGTAAAVSVGGEAVGFATWSRGCRHAAMIETAEISPAHRGRGLGRLLVSSLLDHFRETGVLVVDLNCALGSEEEAFWKAQGFLPYEYRLQYLFPGKTHYRVLVPTLETGSAAGRGELLELWDKDFYAAEGHRPAWTWELSFRKGTRELSAPIVLPCGREWKLRWTLAGRVLMEAKADNFGEGKGCFSGYLAVRSVPEAGE